MYILRVDIKINIEKQNVQLLNIIGFIEEVNNRYKYLEADLKLHIGKQIYDTCLEMRVKHTYRRADMRHTTRHT